jgi:hypothetical protein
MTTTITMATLIYRPFSTHIAISTHGVMVVVAIDNFITRAAMLRLKIASLDLA